MYPAAWLNSTMSQFIIRRRHVAARAAHPMIKS
jgi:hypothetical protein